MYADARSKGSVSGSDCCDILNSTYPMSLRLHNGTAIVSSWVMCMCIYNFDNLKFRGLSWNLDLSRFSRCRGKRRKSSSRKTLKMLRVAKHKPIVFFFSVNCSPQTGRQCCVWKRFSPFVSDCPRLRQRNRTKFNPVWRHVTRIWLLFRVITIRIVSPIVYDPQTLPTMATIPTVKSFKRYGRNPLTGILLAPNEDTSPASSPWYYSADAWSFHGELQNIICRRLST